MVSITLSVPAEIKAMMDHFAEINWSGFVRTAIEDKTKQLSWKEEMLAKLNSEKAFTDWAVDTQRKDGVERIKALKKRGLL